MVLCLSARLCLFARLQKGLAVSLATWVYLAVFMGLTYKGWSPAEFNVISVVNILSVLLYLTLLLAYVEMSRQETAVAVLEKNIELEDANRSLSESREQLRLILDSTAEAIFGVDMHLRCTFCNTSAVEMLGLKSADELLGRDMHAMIHYKDKNGKPLPKTECSFMRTCMEGVSIHMCWRSFGTRPAHGSIRTLWRFLSR
jgi:PAS domain S-box-containing protein